jgi:hypothetical protein
MGRRFWVGHGFFSSPGQVLLRRFRRTTQVSEQLFLCDILYIEQCRFHCGMPSDYREGVPGPRYPGQTRALFKFRQPNDLFHTLKTVTGLLHLVPPRTPRNSGYDVYAHAVYVVI